MKEETKKGLYEFIKKADRILSNDKALLDIISPLWNIYQQPSTGEDDRYKVLGDEIEKHHILNDDWTQDKLYLRILKVMDDDDRMKKFVRDLLNVEDIRINVELVEEVRKTLNQDGLDIIEMNNHLFIGNKNQSSSPACNNNIPFVSCNSNVYHAVEFREKNVQLSQDEKCFILTFNYGWNDFDKFTWFRLYFKEGGELHIIGTLKIMKGSEDNTRNVLPERFYCLSDEYCSLGYDIDYYKNLHSLFGENSMIILSSLQDAAINNIIHDRFADSYIFNQSLIRMNCSERALREGRFYANGKTMSNAYSFVFKYATPYCIDKEERINVGFDFKYNCPSFKRTIGMIGENGVGKSSLIESLSQSIAQKDGNCFIGAAPIFSKVMVISFSPFDVYPSSCQNSVIEYRYCGLMKSKNELLSMDEQIEKFKSNLRQLVYRKGADKLMRIWKYILDDVIAEEVLDSFFEDDTINARTELVDKAIHDFCKNMSSGETIFVYALTEIIANIRYDSLIMLDEPEQHLHPHAITKLLRAIYKVLDKFQSYAIIATHSPLVIREMVSDNVLVFSREDNFLNVAKIGVESFGEDISVLTDVVFKNMNDEKRYEYVVRELSGRYGDDYDKIVEVLQGEHNKLGLSARLMIRTIVESKGQK